MLKILRKLTRYLVNSLAIFGAVTWILIFASSTEWATYETRPAIEKTHGTKLVDEIDQLFENAQKMLRFRAQVGLLDLNTNHVFKKDYSLDRNHIGDFDKPYLLASISKSLTAIMTFQMIENGQLNLSDKYCQQMAIQCSDFSKDITVEELLNHTSGLPRVGINPLLGKFGALIDLFFLEDLKAKDLAGLSIYNPSDAKKVYLYSNLGFRYISYLLERKLRKPFDKLVETNISDRLSLPSLTINDKAIPPIESIIRFGFTKSTSFPVSSRYLPIPKVEPYGDGAIVASLNDMLTLSQKIMERKVFEKDSTHKAFFDEKTDGYFYGLVRSKDEFGEPYYFHNGGYFGCSTMWYIFPRKKFAFVMLSDSGFIRDEGETLIKSVYKLLEGKEYQIPITTRTFPSLNI